MLETGIKGKQETVVTEDKTARVMGSGELDVFATPAMPGHELAERQVTNGYGGVISFGVNTDDKTVERFCAALKVVTFAVSLGHDESLIFPQPS